MAWASAHRVPSPQCGKTYICPTARYDASVSVHSSVKNSPCVVAALAQAAIIKGGNTGKKHTVKVHEMGVIIIKSQLVP